MYKICFYVPASHVEFVKNAMFESGAGKIGLYSHCAWQILGHGQFKPHPGSNPYIGNENTVEIIEEYKVEMVCDDESIKKVIEALKKSHPYEEPAYQVWKIEHF
ncbi:MAG: NGG1p interacting factor NIF3 [Gammaproteobacteria bacterium RIFCSPHIGHO2_12_FULL_38_14]|nr:MAG: NGG1p interacting factor NIF3 [Gammaproteobacteria bacterium RIFCSPHIGHO2_12_FULL_38_14]